MHVEKKLVLKLECEYSLAAGTCGLDELDELSEMQEAALFEILYLLEYKSSCEILQRPETCTG